ncbi:MAG: hypothetical protein JEZ07_14450 [Phycisphaerae bacterium]|nr:hypothetical protein [Phycisphaerae bacterium]
MEFENVADAAKYRIERHQGRRQMNHFNRIVAALELYEGSLAEQARQNRIAGARKGGKANSIDTYIVASQVCTKSFS